MGTAGTVRVLDHAAGAARAGQRVKLVCQGFFLPGGLTTDGEGWVGIEPAPPRAFHLQLDVGGERRKLGPIELSAGALSGEVTVRVVE